MNTGSPGPATRLRAADPADAEAAATLLIASRRQHLPYAPLAHGEADVRRWVREQLLPAGGVTLAEDAAGLAGLLAVSQAGGGGWIDQLYLRPGATGRGLGTRLLQHALATLPRPVQLHTFQANAGARRFYERHGFAAVAFGDGSGNEERCPDVLMRLEAGT
jgi:GNAT superfamily N-acetyltransferase